MKEFFFFHFLNNLQDIFFCHYLSVGCFFLKKGQFLKGKFLKKCIYIYIVAFAVVALIKSCKALNFCKLYNLLNSVLLTFCIAMFSESHSLHSFHVKLL